MTGGVYLWQMVKWRHSARAAVPGSKNVTRLNTSKRVYNHAYVDRLESELSARDVSLG